LRDVGTGPVLISIRTGKALGTLAGVLAEFAAPSCKALGRMLLHPVGELRRSHQAGLHRDLGEVGGGDSLLMTISWRGETAEYGDDLDQDSSPPSLRRALLVL
jgi:hypothetical protein